MIDMAEEDETANVVRLHPDRDLADDDALLHRRRQSRDCRHRRATIHDDAHKLFCRDCDREIDPIDFLIRLMGHWEVHVRHRKEAHRRMVEAKTRLDEILRLERNARARLGRLDPQAAKEAPEKPWGGPRY